MSATTESPQGHDGFDAKAGLNLLYLLARGHATCLTVFMRHSFGVEALGINGLAAVAMILFYACATGDPAMAMYFWVWLAALVVQRLKTFQLVRSGRVEHSRYNGWPWLAMKLRLAKDESAAKNGIEPAICLIGGALLCHVSESLGTFVMMGFFSLLIQRGIETEAERKRVQQMRDAEIEQKQLAERFRGRRKDF